MDSPLRPGTAIGVHPAAVPPVNERRVRKNGQHHHGNREKRERSQFISRDQPQFDNMTGETVPEGGDDSRDKEDGSRVLGRFDPGLEEKDEGLSSQFRRRTMNTLPVKEDMCRGQSRPGGMKKVFTLPPHGLAMALKDMWFQTCRTKDGGRENFLRDSPM